MKKPRRYAKRRSVFETKRDILDFLHHHGHSKITHIILHANVPQTRIKEYLNELWKAGLIDTLDREYFITDFGKKYVIELTNLMSVIGFDSYIKTE